MKRILATLAGMALLGAVAVPGVSATSPGDSCQATALKKADRNFKTHKVVVGLLEGGVTIYAIRTAIEKSKGTPKGAVMSKGGGVLLRNAADKTQWDKFYQQARATCKG
jgi:hypothetical protein